MRSAVLVLLAVLVTGAPVTGPAHATSRRGPVSPAPAAIGYEAPLAGPLVVVRRFEPPPTPYAAGHRGVDLASRPGQPVRAAGGGTVSFAGPVAGRGVIVIVHRDGVRTEYEPVSASVRAGQQVARGQRIGVVHGHHGGCDAGRCLHWGARLSSRRDGYFDPLRLLRPLGPVRLLPWRGAVYSG